MNSSEKFPALPIDEWEDTLTTIHLWSQIVGKIKLALMPRRNHWWNITLHMSPRGITTGSIPCEKGTFQMDFNFKEHLFEITPSWGEKDHFQLSDGLTVSNFYNNLFGILNNLGIDAPIIPVPYDHPCDEPFAICVSYAHYNKEYVTRFWKIYLEVDKIFKEFSGRFYGKVSPSHIFWHHFDLAITRFSGNKGPKLAENATIADMEAYSHEVISAGFWAGDKSVREPAFYSYTYPSPERIEKEPLMPDAAYWDLSSGSPMALLMYDDIRNSENPEKLIMDFLESSYKAGARKANWDSELTV